MKDYNKCVLQLKLNYIFVFVGYWNESCLFMIGKPVYKYLTRIFYTWALAHTNITNSIYRLTLSLSWSGRTPDTQTGPKLLKQSIW
jgi:hypothetical protein